jgi:hypothetical protein
MAFLVSVLTTLLAIPNPNNSLRSTHKQAATPSSGVANSTKNSVKATTWAPVKASRLLMDSVCGDLSTGDLLRSVNTSKGIDVFPNGLVGQIRCVDPDDPGMPALVCWPGWTGGHDNTGPCADTPLAACGPLSSWWVACPQVERVDHTSLCGNKFKVGDAVIAAIDNPGGAASLPKGSVGQVYCVVGDAEIGVNWGTNWVHGHDGSVDFCVETPLPRSGPTSAWYVGCDTLEALANATSAPVPPPAPVPPAPVPPVPPTPPIPASCATSASNSTCHGAGACKWCVSKDLIHALCFATAALPPAAAWDCA